MTYVSIPIETDEDLTSAEAFDYIASQFDGWAPSEGQLDTWLIMAVARLASDLKDTASGVSTDIFRYFGRLMGVTPFDDIPASVITNWTLTDTAGHTILAGTRVGVYDENLDTHEFLVAADTVVPAGTAVANGIQITSANAGTLDNGLGANGSQAIPLDGTVWVASITLTSATGGGADAEEDDAYMDRLSSVLTTMSPRPILANDFAILARDIAGVDKAIAIDGYNPANSSYNNERMIAVAVTDSAGNAVSGTIKTSVQTYLDGLREVNFVVNVIDPTYTTIDVQWDVNMWPGYDSATLSTNINAAIAAFLNPATWGQPPGGDPNLWYARSVVKVNDLIAAIGNVDGVKDVNTVTMRTGAGSFATTDITIAGAAPLPRTGTTTGTVH